MAEHSAVNRRVVSSSLTWGAKQNRPSFDGLFCLSFKYESYSPRLTASAEKTCTEPSARSAGCSEAEARVKQEKNAQCAVFGHVSPWNGLQFFNLMIDSVIQIGLGG